MRELTNKAVASALALLALIVGCSTTKNLVLKEESAIDRYESIKRIIIEEADNNGYHELISETKPSQYNKWTGAIVFAVRGSSDRLTTDKLYINTAVCINEIYIWIKAWGGSVNEDSAVKAISERLQGVGFIVR